MPVMIHAVYPVTLDAFAVAESADACCCALHDAGGTSARVVLLSFHT
jgi:hypothetical protein